MIRIETGEGSFKPYYLKAKGLKPTGVFVRQGSSSVPASPEQIRQMIKISDGDIFETMRSMEQEITFEQASNTFKKYDVDFAEEKFPALGIRSLQDGLFTNLAWLISDQCRHTVKAAVFGDDTNTVFKDAKEFRGSVFKQLDEVFSYLMLCNRTSSIFKGLERVDLVIPPLMPYVDVLMGTKGVFRSCIPPTTPAAKCVRVTYDSTVLYDDMSNGGGFACDIENAIRMDADCMAVQTFIGSAGESRSLELLSRTADAGTRYGIPTLGVVAVGKEMARTEQFFPLATRVLAENGVNIVKSYYCDGFENVAAACPVPIVIAGGKKLPELEALEMTYRAINEGAHGVDMGRNIFQSDCPVGMTQAIAKVVHEGYTAKQAYEVYEEIKNAK